MDIQQQTTRLEKENQQYSGTGGVSQKNQHLGFSPAFMDECSGDIEISRFLNGMPAPFHLIDGLPEAWVVARDTEGRVVELKSSVISGFVRMGRFFTREEAAEMVQQFAS